ncbi:MAG: bis(5'-nucleosyl)-tetraphosphatase (symmetrical) YqeK [Lutisporaceae bacterium]
MNKILHDFIDGFMFTDIISIDSNRLLKYHNQEEVAEHSLKVASEAVKIADRFGLNTEEAELAGFLHDISKIIHEADMVRIAYELNIDVLEAEKSYPDLLHTKLSSVMAREIFNIKNSTILSAIECHSTLKSNPGKLDLVLFIADKISWEIEDNQHFICELIQGLDKSLEHGSFAYVNYLYSNKEKLRVIHPWLIDAYYYLREFCLE